ncbi:hypothetical protein KAH81_00370 [bacterium]|nr:hypothetical protein [bacterium]
MDKTTHKIVIGDSRDMAGIDVISYIKNEKVYDRFTFDFFLKTLLSLDFDHEEAKNIILNNCLLSTLVLQERIYNNYYKKISENEEMSEDLKEEFRRIKKIQNIEVIDEIRIEIKRLSK